MNTEYTYNLDTNKKIDTGLTQEQIDLQHKIISRTYRLLDEYDIDGYWVTFVPVNREWLARNYDREMIVFNNLILTSDWEEIELLIIHEVAHHFHNGHGKLFKDKCQSMGGVRKILRYDSDTNKIVSI